MKMILTLLVAFTLSSCVVYDTWDRCETMKKGEMRFTFPADEIAREIKIKRTSLPEKCEKYKRAYTEDDWDSESETYPINVKWAECMGVGYR